MTTAQQPAKIRLTETNEILTAVPYLLGWKPSPGDLVVIVTSGGLADMTMRFPTGPDLYSPSGAARAAEQRIKVSVPSAATVFLIAYGPAPMDDYLSVMAGRLHHLDVTAAGRVEDGLFYSIICPDPGCACLTSGVPIRVDGRVEAEFTLAGYAVADSRDAIGDYLAPAGGQWRADVDRADVRARAVFTRLGARVGADEMRRAADRAVQALIDDFNAGRAGTLAPQRVAWVAMAMEDLMVRDRAIGRVTAGRAHAHKAMWIRLAQLAPASATVQILAAAALVSLTAGDCVTAVFAAERALALDPQHSLAQLVTDMVRSGYTQPEAILRSVTSSFGRTTPDGVVS